MKLEAYIHNAELAFASEIFNAQAKTEEEMMLAIRKAQEEKRALEAIISKYSKVYACLLDVAKDLEYYEANLIRLREFEESKEAELIADFIQNGNETSLEELKSMIAIENPFDIRIVPAWQNGDRERGYGVPYEVYFDIGYTRTFYKFDNFDLLSDIKKHEAGIDNWKERLQKLNKNRDEMLVEHGSCLSILDDGAYEAYLDDEEEW